MTINFNMFNGPDFPTSLDEEVFNEWIEKGKLSKLGYQYLLVLWDEFESAYKPHYVQERNEIDHYERYKSSTGHESLVAAYDLYSESRIT